MIDSFMSSFTLPLNKNIFKVAIKGTPIRELTGGCTKHLLSVEIYHLPGVQLDHSCIKMPEQATEIWDS